jgi:NAD(P)-dependent dehydrogenase (short-subunit alcohol dehydrogenase family)
LPPAPGLNRGIGAATGEALALQRRAEAALYRGQPAEATALLEDALAVAHESDAGFHLLDRIYGTKITAASSPASCLAALEEAESAIRGPDETCPGCRITLAVPAAIAAARTGDAGWAHLRRCHTKLSGARRGEEFQLDVVRVAEDQHRSVVLVGDG